MFSKPLVVNQAQTKKSLSNGIRTFKIVQKPKLPEATSEEVLQFLKELFDECELHYPDVVAQVSWELIKERIADIFNHIWLVSQNGPKHMKEDKGRSIKLAFLFVSEDKVQYTIMLTPQQYYTILFVMSCLRIQSTKGRKVESDPNDTKKTVKAKKKSKPVKKPKNTLVDQKMKEEKLKKNHELTASDIAERMTKDLPRSVVKYYRVIISDEYVQIIDTKNQPFRPLLNDVKFHEFMKQKKSPQKKRRVSECDWSEEPSDEGVVGHGPHKSLRVGVETTPHEGMAFAPIQEDQPTQQEPEVNVPAASMPTLEDWFANVQYLLETDPKQFYQEIYPYMPLYEVLDFNSWLESRGSAARVVVNLAQSDDFNVIPSMQYEQTLAQVPASQDYSANQLWSTQHSTMHVQQSPATQTLLEGIQAINNDTSQQGYTATLGTTQYYCAAQVPAADAQPFEDDPLGVTFEDLSQSTVQLTSFDETLASQPLHDFESGANDFVGGYANPQAASISATN